MRPLSLPLIFPYWIGPSWSWMSLDFDGAFLFTAQCYKQDPFTKQVPLVRVLGAAVVPQDGFDEFGPLVGGQVTLAGRTSPVNLAQLAGLGTMAGIFKMHVVPCGGCEVSLIQAAIDENPKYPPDNIEVVADVFLPIFAKRDTLHGCVKCLLLKRICYIESANGDGKASAYTRVGVLSVSLDEWWESESNFETHKMNRQALWNEGLFPERWTTGMILEAAQVLGGVIAMGRAALASSNPEEVADMSEVITIY